MKHFFCGILALAATAAPALAKDANPLEYRRTLFAPAGQRTLVLEAPLGMCFMDPTYYQEQMVTEDMKGILDETGGGQLLGVFAPCMSIAAFDAGGKSAAMGVSGVVTWLNPSVGETTALGQASYLDMQETKFRDYLDHNLGNGGEDAAKDDDAQAPDAPDNLTPAYAALTLPWPGDYAFDAKPARTQNSVTVGYTAALDRDGMKSVASGVAATAVIRHTPIALYLNYTQKTPYDRKVIRDLADKFMAQQIALNR